MRTSRSIVALIKITNFPDDVLSGDLYCNRIQYYRDSEADEIGDKYEGIQFRKKIFNTWIDVYDPSVLLHPAFCMYSVDAKRNNHPKRIQLPPDERLKTFGECAVVITNVKEFITRINNKLPEFKCEAVWYTNMKDLQGVYRDAIFNPLATKHQYFSYQKEFRIYSDFWFLGGNLDPKVPYFYYAEEDHKKFPVGDLREIAQVHPIEDLFTGIDVDLNIDWSYTLKEHFQPIKQWDKEIHKEK